MHDESIYFSKLYNGPKSTTTISCSPYDITNYMLYVVFRANSENDTFSKLLWWTTTGFRGPEQLRFEGGDNLTPTYITIARIWGGDKYTIGYTVDYHNNQNWVVGIIEVYGIWFKIGKIL